MPNLFAQITDTEYRALDTLGPQQTQLVPQKGLAVNLYQGLRNGLGQGPKSRGQAARQDSHWKAHELLSWSVEIISVHSSPIQAGRNRPSFLLGYRSASWGTWYGSVYVYNQRRSHYNHTLAVIR